MTKATMAKIASRTQTHTPISTDLPPEESEGVISVVDRKGMKVGQTVLGSFFFNALCM